MSAWKVHHALTYLIFIVSLRNPLLSIAQESIFNLFYRLSLKELLFINIFLFLPEDTH